MSGANSIHGIVLVGAMFIAVEADDPLSQLLSFVAVAFATMNVVGGYVVTDRMLQMFRDEARRAQAGRRGRRPDVDAATRSRPSSASSGWLGAACFVLGLMRMNSPATARNGNLVSAGGMSLAIAGDRRPAPAPRPRPTASAPPAGSSSSSASRSAAALGLYTARTVKMTAMPQLVSLFNAVGGGAAALIAIDDYLRLARTTVAVRLEINVFDRPRHRHRLDHVHRLADRVGQAHGPRSAGKPIMIPGGQLVTAALAAIVVVAAIYLWAGNLNVPVMFVILAAALIFGVTMTLPIGGADMPVVISPAELASPARPSRWPASCSTTTS